MDNYRPISLLSCFSKILEKIVANRVMNYLNWNNIISNNQFGFRKKHSTSQPLLHFLNETAKALSNKKHVAAVFCDLRKAFDCCNHDILISKLKKYGFEGNAISWFSSYLSDRKQFVHIDDTSSNLINISIGVPQGSILGPLLFLVYNNDLPNCTKLGTLLFADNTTAWECNSNMVDLMNHMNTEFYKLTTYFRSNKLAIHPNKTKLMIFTSNH
jgi:hypothetical protein